MNNIRVVTLSDTHLSGPKLTVPDGDLLLHAGDHTFRGNHKETVEALDWLASLPHKHKVFIAGNHDWLFDKNAPIKFRDWLLPQGVDVEALLADYPTLTYLQDSSVEIEGYKVYGSPWQPWYHGWAFNFSADPEREEIQAKATWANIPDDVDILLTHTPPRGILDKAHDSPNKLGDKYLLERLEGLNNLKLHVFGHIHEAFGRADYLDEETDQKVTFVNAACLDRTYKHANPPITVNLEESSKLLRLP